MFDVTIIGCGVVGASIAHTLSKYQLRVLVLEKENDVAMGTTKANSAIVHAGYDPLPGSLMARLNLRGSAMMEDLCNALSVGYRKTGSLVVAFQGDDLSGLETLYRRGIENGVPGLALLEGAQARAMEPHLAPNVAGALYAPSAAIVDPWGLCIAQMEVAVQNGVELRLRSPVTAVKRQRDVYRLDTPSGAVESRYVVNCAGCHGETVSALAGSPGFHTLPSRGQYYLMDHACGDLVSHVIFQCPDRLGKGVLVAPTVHGNLIVGPNAEPAGPDDTATTREGLLSVADTARRSVPALDMRQCIRNFAGVRANTDRNDFIIGPVEGAPRFFQVAGIRSPGLSAAPAIGEYMQTLLVQDGLTFKAKSLYTKNRTVRRFRDLDTAGKQALLAENPLYGRVVCRCETITEGEIVDAIRSPIPPRSLDGVKRRAGAGMGRCQGGFCGPKVLDILAREWNVPREAITQDQAGTWILAGNLNETETSR